MGSIKSKESAYHPAQIGFDIDGVVSDTMEAFLRIAREEYGIQGLSKEQITSYWLEECLPVPPRITEEIIARILQDPFGINLEPIPGARESLLEIGKKAPLTFITARPIGGPIEEWLRELLVGLPPENIRVIATGKHEAKTRVIQDLGLRCFVEDHLETCRAIWNAGIGAVVFNQPWNQGPVPFPRIYSWNEFLNLVKIQEGQSD